MTEDDYKSFSNSSILLIFDGTKLFDRMECAAKTPRFGSLSVLYSFGLKNCICLSNKLLCFFLFIDLFIMPIDGARGMSGTIFFLITTGGKPIFFESASLDGFFSEGSSSQKSSAYFCACEPSFFDLARAFFFEIFYFGLC